MGTSQTTRGLLAIIALALADIPTSHVQVPTDTWTGTASGLWSVGTNWLGGTAPPVGGGINRILQFNLATNTNVNATNNRGAPFVLNGLLLNDTGGDLFTLTIDNSFNQTIQLAADGLGNNPFINVLGSGSVTIITPTIFAAPTSIGGTGNGRLTFSGGPMSGSGPIPIDPAANSNTVISGSTFGLTSNFILNSGNLDAKTNLGSGTITFNGGSLAFSNGLSNAITANATLEIARGSLGGLGAVSGAGGLRISGTQQSDVTLSAANTYAGAHRADRQRPPPHAFGPQRHRAQHDRVHAQFPFRHLLQRHAHAGQLVGRQPQPRCRHRPDHPQRRRFRASGPFDQRGDRNRRRCYGVGMVGRHRPHEQQQRRLHRADAGVDQPWRSAATSCSTGTTSGRRPRGRGQHLHHRVAGGRVGRRRRRGRQHQHQHPAVCQRRRLRLFRGRRTGHLRRRGHPSPVRRRRRIRRPGARHRVAEQCPRHGLGALPRRRDDHQLRAGAPGRRPVDRRRGQTDPDQRPGDLLFQRRQPFDSQLAFGAAEANIQTSNDFPAVGVFTVNSVISGTNGLTKSGTSSLWLRGADTYTGVTTINNGSLNILSSANLGGSSTVFISDGNLEYAGAGETFTRAVVLGDGNGQIDVRNANAAFTVANPITGAGDLRVGGYGTLVLAAANTYAGDTIISGTAAITNEGNLGSGGKVVLSSGRLRTLAPMTINRPVWVANQDSVIDTFGSNVTLAGDLVNSSTVSNPGANNLIKDVPAR